VVADDVVAAVVVPAVASRSILFMKISPAKRNLAFDRLSNRKSGIHSESLNINQPPREKCSRPARRKLRQSGSTPG